MLKKIVCVFSIIALFYCTPEFKQTESQAESKLERDKKLDDYLYRVAPETPIRKCINRDIFISKEEEEQFIPIWVMHGYLKINNWPREEIDYTCYYLDEKENIMSVFNCPFPCTEEDQGEIGYFTITNYFYIKKPII